MHTLQMKLVTRRYLSGSGCRKAIVFTTACLITQKSQLEIP